MNKKINAFTVNTLKQAEEVILSTKIYNIIPILHFKYHILKSFGYEYILTLQKILISKFGKSKFKLSTDCGFDSSLGIKMAINKIEYIKLSGNKTVLQKFKDIAKKNRVLFNPSFNIVDCRRIKNINLKIKKLYFRKIK